MKADQLARIHSLIRAAVRLEEEETNRAADGEVRSTEIDESAEELRVVLKGKEQIRCASLVDRRY